MKTKSLPTWKERQKLLFSKNRTVSASQINLLGDLAFDQGFLEDALEYYKGAKNSEGFKKLKTQALKASDVFLLLQLDKIGITLSVEQWNDVGFKAYGSGKIFFAREAFKKSSNEEMINKIQTEIEKDRVIGSSNPSETP